MKYAVFILSHNRADRVETYDTLKNLGYSGEVYIVVDDEDPMLSTYIKRFGEIVVVFNKSEWIKSTDTVTNIKLKSSPVYARSAIEHMANSALYDAYIVMDDDIKNLRYRFLESGMVKSVRVTQDIDSIFDLYVEYLLTANIATLSFATVMVYAGGVHNEADLVRIASHRYTCQIHIRNLKFPVDWISLANNDSISANNTAKIGYLWWSLPFIVYDSPKMNTLPGGMKKVYDSVSEFKRAFMSTVVSPSVCRVGCAKDRLSIQRNLKAAYPMIVSSKWKK